jgi:hypothetical protein
MEIKTKKGEIILVSECDFEKLNKITWWTLYNYAQGRPDNKNILMHRFIMIELVGNKNLTSKELIDHINGNRADNRRENLRIVTHAENNRNKIKATNASSKYFGVTKNADKFMTTIILLDKSKLFAYYDNEIHAAYQYDLWVDKYNIKYANKNNIELPENFIEYKKDIRELPKNIIQRKDTGKYRIYFKNGYTGNFKTLKEAEEALVKIKESYEKELINKRLSQKIKRNSDGQPIIELFNRKKEKVGETIVDEDNYYYLIQFGWSLKPNGYAYGRIEDKTHNLLHRYILKYTGDNMVDHINNNPLDNRKCNLRIVTPSENSRNKSFNKNSSSKYIGVSLTYNNKWRSQITINNKNIFLGIFENEIDAAKSRDVATKEHFGKYGKLNFPNTL